MYQVVFGVNLPQRAEPQLPIEAGLVRHYPPRYFHGRRGFIVKLIFLPSAIIPVLRVVVIRSEKYQLRPPVVHPRHLSEQTIGIGHMEVLQVLVSALG